MVEEGGRVEEGGGVKEGGRVEEGGGVEEGGEVEEGGKVEEGWWGGKGGKRLTRNSMYTSMYKYKPIASTCNYVYP